MVLVSPQRMGERPKNNFLIWPLLTPESSLGFPASAMPNQVD